MTTKDDDPEVRLNVVSQLFKSSKSRFSFRDNSLVCNVCGQGFESLPSAIVHWRSGQCRGDHDTRPETNVDTDHEVETNGASVSLDKNDDVIHSVILDTTKILKKPKAAKKTARAPRSKKTVKSSKVEQKEEEEEEEYVKVEVVQNDLVKCEVESDGETDQVDPGSILKVEHDQLEEIKTEVLEEEFANDNPLTGPDYAESKYSDHVKVVKLNFQRNQSAGDNPEPEESTDLLDDNNYDDNHEDYSKVEAKEEAEPVKLGIKRKRDDDDDEYDVKKHKHDDEEESDYEEDEEEFIAEEKPTKKRIRKIDTDTGEHDNYIKEEADGWRCTFGDCFYKNEKEHRVRRHLARSHLAVKYNCVFCDEARGIKEGGLKRHVWNHHPDMEWNLQDHPLAEKEGYSGRSLVKDEDGNFLCRHCDFSTDKYDAFKHHRKFFHMLRSCFKCDYQVHNHDIMKEHVKDVHEGEETQCEYCNRTFVSREDLEKHCKQTHVEKVHGDAQKLHCDHCDWTSYIKKEMRRHVRTHHDDAPSDCPFCEKSFEDFTGYSKHRKLVHDKDKNLNNEVLHCNECDWSGIGAFRLRRHVENLHRGELKRCTICDFSSPYLYYVKRHQQSEHREQFPPEAENFNCEFCGKFFYTKDSLRKHRLRYHEGSMNAGEEKLKCDRCDFEADGKNSLRQHQQKTHEKIHRCEHCDYITHKRSTLKTHVMVKHLGIKGVHDKKSYKCTSCRMVFTKATDLKEHLSSVHNEETEYFYCDECPQSYLTKAGLANHKKMKHNPNGIILTDLRSKKERVYCESCEYSSYSKQDMERHFESKHLGIRHYCELCGWSSATKAQLRYHMVGVHGEGYHCELCDFKTKHPSALRTHKMAVHEQIKHSCDQCNFSTSFQFSLKEHMKRIHKVMKFE